MGAYVGQLSKKGGLGVMVNWRFADGANFLPPYEEVKALRKE
jgi:branched-chain amino acid transport system substrate-binding protein